MGSERYAARDADDLVRLVDENPLVWIFLEDEVGPFATGAPVRPVAADGQLQQVIGHVPRGSRIHRALRAPCKGLILVLGPHGYVSPSWLSDRTQAPTWNFTSARLLAVMEAIEDPALLEDHLRGLVKAMERSREDAWRVEEMGPRMQRLAAGVVAFGAKITDRECRFKLGQDEEDQTFAEIMRGLEREGNEGLRRWMREFNPSRE
ncbi:MAG: FMN-binding negative transcriptional regulator [Gammaproteobacteria bacterium]|nr:FMN-binding negative transcriptional regulator [Gammaproteobacteria bacterium]